MKVVCYAVNGSGIGHLKRLIAVAHNLWRIGTASANPPSIYFLTSSEASHLLFYENFPVFKFPSREVLEKAGIKVGEFAKLAKNWTANTLQLLKPDLLLVDTFPAGYYEELIDSIPFSKHSAIIHRPLKFDNLERGSFYRNMSFYDAIIVPEKMNGFESQIPPEILDKTYFFGAAISGEKEELASRTELRRKLNVRDDEFLLYVSAGGGGDCSAEQTIYTIYNALANLPNLKFVIGAGLLYQGKKIYSENVIWLTAESAFSLMPAFDAGFSAAGYNSFYELLHTGVPTVFIPQKKWADDQSARANGAAKANAAIVYEKLPNAEEIRRIMKKLTNENVRRDLSHNAQQFVPVNYASEIADCLFQRFFGF